MSKGISITVAILIVTLANIAQGQYNATCRGRAVPGIITPAHFFDVDRMMGKWYMQSIRVSEAADVVPQTTSCLETDFVREGDTSITATETLFNSTQDQTVTLVSDIVIEASLLLPLESIWSSMLDGELVSQIVWTQTTYDDWALMYACQMMEGNYRYEYLVTWVRNPERALDEITTKVLTTVSEGYGFRPENLLPIDNSKCQA